MGGSSQDVRAPAKQSGLWAGLDALEKSIALTELRQKYCQVDLEGGRSPSGTPSGASEYAWPGAGV